MVDVVLLYGRKDDTGGDSIDQNSERNLWLFAANVVAIKINYCAQTGGNKKFWL
jgi:hypothetical protein